MQKQKMKEKERARLADAYEKYNKMVLKTIYAQTGDYCAAQDICHDTFEKLAKVIEEFPESRIKPWLLMTSGNGAKDHYRSLKNWEKLHETLREQADSEYFRMCQESDADWAAKHLERITMLEILEELRCSEPELHDALMLTSYLGIPGKNAARIQGVRYGTLRNRVTRAKKWVKTEYKRKMRS